MIINNCLEISSVEDSIANAIKSATYDPDAEVNSSDSLINDLSIDSLEMQVIFQQLSAEYGVAIKIKDILVSINDIIESLLAIDDNNYNMILGEITNKVGLSFTEEDNSDFLDRKVNNQNRNLMVRCILEYITVNSVANCIIFLRGAKMNNRVVITGIGIASPAGNTISDAWNSWENGMSNTDRLPGFDFAAAQVKNPLLDYSGLNLPDHPINRASEFALSALIEALDSAQLSSDDVDPYETGVLIGVAPSFSNDELFHQELTNHRFLSLDSVKNEYAQAIKKGHIHSDKFEYFSCGYHPASTISSALGIRRLSRGISNACASGAYSVCMGYDLIKTGRLGTAITGGTGAVINTEGLSLFSVLDVMSKDSDFVHACRPFDKNRSGLVIGEGAGIIILESLDRAQKRGAPIFAEVLGYSAITDTYHITTPETTGELCGELILDAIDASGIPSECIDYINAHGTSTYYNDVIETKGIKKAFGEKAYDIPISSLKSMIGHLMSAAGAVELIATIMTIKNSIILPTINYETADPDCDLDYVANIKRKKAVRYAISNSFGFGGQNVSVVLGGVMQEL